ncbi:MAG TPA: uracil-DNA glycosylase [Candidatus Eisenbacteria bacterium]|nr:uracil-DNA glycosylase [Candidatus Eisenbacteria bacterium]
MTGTRHAHSLDRIAVEITRCERCPRLMEYCREVARVKRAAYRTETYWGKPVSGFGDPSAWLLIVGLAPGAHGANRTGRMFTGDKSGEWLYGELYEHGLASRPQSTRADDGLKLYGAYVTAAARCAPPGNKPLPEELELCREFLVREMEALDRVKVVLALGRIGFDAYLKARRDLGRPPLDPKPEFWHGSVNLLPEGVFLLASYHPSQQNTSTGTLTASMWRAIFTTARSLRDRL